MSETTLRPDEYHVHNIGELDKRVRKGFEYLIDAPFKDSNWDLWDKLATRLQYLRECQFVQGDRPIPEFAPFGKWFVSTV